MGSSPPGTTYDESGEGTPFNQGVRDFGVRFPHRRAWTSAPGRLAGASDTLLSVWAPVGPANLASEELRLGRGLAGLRSRSRHPMTLFHQVRAAKAAWSPHEAEGSVFGSINQSQLAATRVPTVARDREDDLERDLAVIEDRLAVALSESRQLAQTRNELLPLLMSGKIRVSEAEQLVVEST